MQVMVTSPVEGLLIEDRCKLQICGENIDENSYPGTPGVSVKQV